MNLSEYTGVFFVAKVFNSSGDLVPPARHVSNAHARLVVGEGTW